MHGRATQPWQAFVMLNKGVSSNRHPERRQVLVRSTRLTSFVKNSHRRLREWVLTGKCVAGIFAQWLRLIYLILDAVTKKAEHAIA